MHAYIHIYVDKLISNEIIPLTTPVICIYSYSTTIPSLIILWLVVLSNYIPWYRMICQYIPIGIPWILVIVIHTRNSPMILNLSSLNPIKIPLFPCFCSMPQKHIVPLCETFPRISSPMNSCSSWWLNAFNHHFLSPKTPGEQCDLNPCWLMISWGIIPPFIYWGWEQSKDRESL